jgi:uncharacterized protein DUF6093
VTADSLIVRAQAAAQALMVDTCTVRRVTGTSTNTTTGAVTPTYSTIYTGACKVQQRQAIARPETIGEATVFISRLELHLPVTVTGVASDDLVTVTASVHDADLVGRTFHIRELAHKSFLTARRFSMIEVTS